jgi:hypothetical protein
MTQTRTTEPAAARAPAAGGSAAAHRAGGPTALPAETRAAGTVRTNRIVLVLLGLVLAVAGAAGLAAGLGAFGRRLTHQPVLGPAATRFVARNGWFWPVVAVAGGVLALLCLWWLLRQARSNRVGEIRLVTDRRRGNTDLAARALTEAVETEVEGYRGVARASASLSGATTAPRLLLTVTLDGRVKPAEVHERVVGEAVSHVREALGRDDIPTRLDLRLTRGGRRDVR